MKQVAEIAFYSIIAVVATTILQDVWWITLNCFPAGPDSFGYYDYEALWETIPCFDAMFNIVYYLQFIKIAGWIALLYFFYKLYNIQTEEMKKPSLYAIYGIALILASTIYFTFLEQIFDFSNTLRIICYLFQIAGFALLIPFFLTLYKKSN